MCNRYVSPDQAAIERYWQTLPSQPWAGGGVYPRAKGAFIRPKAEKPELVVGIWGLIPWFAKEAKLKYQTNNARSEELAEKASYKDPWKRGQRCVIPATSFDEPNWETGKNIWWTFRRMDGEPWGLAGLWNTWVDKATGERIESYTMLTLNADSHPLMSRMHKPDPKLRPDQQDKRSVIPIDRRDVEQWLFGTMEDAKSLMKLAPVEMFSAAPQ